MRPLSPLLLLSLCACDGDAPSDTTSGTSTTEPTPTTPTTPTTPSTTDTASDLDPWLARDHEGSLVAHRVGPLGESVGVNLYGLFVDDLQGAGTGLWCRNQGVCIDGLPGQGGQRVELAFRQGLSRYDWVGERLAIGFDPRRWVVVPFLPDVLSDFGTYQRYDVSFDEDEIPPYNLEFEGSWGDVEVDGAFGVPRLPRFTLTNTEIAFNSTNVEFTWEYPPEDVVPKGEGEMYLRIVGNELHEILPVPDTGSYRFDLSTYGFNPSSNVDVFIGRWTHDTVTVGLRNELDIYAVAENKVSTRRCSTGPTFGTTARLPGTAPGVLVEATGLSIGFRGVLDQGEVVDFREDTTGLGFDSRSSEIRFQVHDDDGNRCELRYDASPATAASSFPASSGAWVHQAFELQPNPNSLYEACEGPALGVEATSGDADAGTPIVVTVAPGRAENDVATLNQRSVATREVPVAAGGLARHDLVVIGLDGIEVLTGTEGPAGTVSAPSPGSKQVALAIVEIVGDEVIAVSDERTFFHRLPDGFADPSARSLIEGRTWTFGFGEALEHRFEVDDGSDAVWGFFAVDPDTELGVEMGAGTATHLSDCYTVDPDGTRLDYRSGQILPSGLYEMTGFGRFPIVAPVDTGMTADTGAP